MSEKKHLIQPHLKKSPASSHVLGIKKFVPPLEGSGGPPQSSTGERGCFPPAIY